MVFTWVENLEASSKPRAISTQAALNLLTIQLFTSFDHLDDVQGVELVLRPLPPFQHP